MKKAFAALAILACFAASAWFVFLFLEGDACVDGGGAFDWRLARCDAPPGFVYTSVVHRGTWLFWALYGGLTLALAPVIGGVLGGVVAGVRSLRCDVQASP